MLIDEVSTGTRTCSLERMKFMTEHVSWNMHLQLIVKQVVAPFYIHT
jgi:hypothetical protein